MTKHEKKPGNPWLNSDKELIYLSTVSWRFPGCIRTNPVWFLTGSQTGFSLYISNYGRHTMKTLISCAYTMDNCCVELKFRDGRMIAIDTIAVENEIADNMYQRSELDYLIYNDPIAYADLILNGDPETYLKTVTEYKPLDSWQHAARRRKSCGRFSVYLFSSVGSQFWKEDDYLKALSPLGSSFQTKV